MFAIRHNSATPTLTLRRVHEKPARGSIGAKRNPESTRAILDAAEMILNRDGLAGLSMDAIARLAQCGKPTLYRWWPDKCSLLADLHERAIPAFEAKSEDSTLDERIDELQNHWAYTWRSTLAGIELRGMLAEAQSSPAARRTLEERGLAPYRLALEQLVASHPGRESAEPIDLEAMLRQTLFLLLGELMLTGDVMKPLRTGTLLKPVMREVRETGAAELQNAESVEKSVEEFLEHTVRHRGEWVD